MKTEDDQVPIPADEPAPVDPDEKIHITFDKDEVVWRQVGDFLTVGPGASSPWTIVEGPLFVDEADRQKVEAYLMAKYGIASEPKAADPEPPAQSWRDRPPLL